MQDMGDDPVYGSHAGKRRGGALYRVVRMQVNRASTRHRDRIASKSEALAAFTTFASNRSNS